MKRILSALMFAAVLFGMTNVMSSCKDYDYDIEQLRNELNKKSSLEQFQDSVNNLNIKIQQELATSAAAKKAADEAVKAAAEAKQAGLDAAAQAKAAALAADEALKGELEAYVDQAREQALAAAQEYIDKELTTLRDSLTNAYNQMANLQEDIIALKNKVDNIPVDEFKTNIKTLQEQYTEIRNRFTAIVGAYSTMVTSVDIFQEVKDDGSLAVKPALNFMVAEEKANTFGIGGKQITFADNKMAIYGDSVIIRVNPTGAAITKDMVKLLDSQNNNLDNFIEVEKVEQVEDLLTSRSATPNGLWKVVFKLKSGYDVAALNKATGAAFDNNGAVTSYRLFAIGITNSKSETLDTRCVVSNYGLKVKTSTFSRATDLLINNTHIKDIMNRFTNDGPKAGTTAATRQLKDYLWSNATKGCPLTGNPAVTPVTTGSGSNVAPVYDSRNNMKALNVEYIDGKYEMELDFSAGGATNGVRAFYVTLDNDYVSSIENGIDPTEREAWARYHYTNLDKLFEGSKGKISVDESTAIKDEEIGFRVFAVNYDGTLADPDGFAFYVSLGDNGPVTDRTINATICPSLDGETKHATIALGSEFKGSTTWNKITYYNSYNRSHDELTENTTAEGTFTAYAEADAIGEYQPFDIVFRSNDDGSGSIVAPRDAKSIVVAFKERPSEYLDNETYTIPLKLVNGNENNKTVYTVYLKIKKTLSDYNGLEFNAGLLDEETKVFTAFVTADNGSWGWTDNSYAESATGTYDLNRAIKTNIKDGNWDITITGIDGVNYDKANGKWTGIPAEKIISASNDPTVYSVKAVYTDPNSRQDKNYTRQTYTYEGYKVRLASWWYNMTAEYTDNGRPNLEYGKNLTAYDLRNISVNLQNSLYTNAKNVSDLLGAASTHYIYQPTFTLDGDIKGFYTIDQSSINVIEHGPNNYEVYRIVSFIKTGADRPATDITGTLTISGKDIFGKTVRITMPLTMTK